MAGSLVSAGRKWISRLLGRCCMGGDFRLTVTDPADTNRVITVTRSYGKAGIYQSQDQGDSWDRIGDTPGSYLYDMIALDFSTLYAVDSGDTFFVSNDSGFTWSASPINASFNFNIACLHADPADPDTIYAAGRGYSTNYTYTLAFCKSTDGGNSWQANQFFSYEYLWIRDLAVSKTNPNIIFAVGNKEVGTTSLPALFKSEDGGASWVDISHTVNSSNTNNFGFVAIDPENANRIYLGGRYFHLSTDCGNIWTQDMSAYCYSGKIRIDPTDASRIYVGSYNDLFVSTNKGITWSSHNNCITGRVEHIEVSKKDPSQLFMATTYGGGLFRSTDSGVSWNTANEGIYATTIAALEIAPSKPDRLIASLDYASTLMGTDNGGKTWEELKYPTGCNSSMETIHIQSNDPDVVLAFEGYS